MDKRSCLHLAAVLIALDTVKLSNLGYEDAPRSIEWVPCPRLVGRLSGKPGPGYTPGQIYDFNGPPLVTPPLQERHIKWDSGAHVELV